MNPRPTSTNTTNTMTGRSPGPAHEATQPGGGPATVSTNTALSIGRATVLADRARRRPIFADDSAVWTYTCGAFLLDAADLLYGVHYQIAVAPRYRKRPGAGVLLAPVLAAASTYVMRGSSVPVRVAAASASAAYGYHAGNRITHAHQAPHHAGTPKPHPQRPETGNTATAGHPARPALALPVDRKTPPRDQTDTGAHLRLRQRRKYVGWPPTAACPEDSMRRGWRRVSR
jgi:hypothetical protein